MTVILEGVTLVGIVWLIAGATALVRHWRCIESLLRSTNTLGSSDQIMERWEETSHRFEAAVKPFADGLERFSEQLDLSENRFSQRLENASHNVLQSVEGMREAASGLMAGTAGIDLCYARLAAMYERFEPIAAQVAGSHGDQQQQLAEIAAGLHGITQSLTTVVASANESQAAVARVADTVAGALTAIQEASVRMEASVERLAAALEAGARAGRASEEAEASTRQSVSLRLIMEQQQQFINVLDQRLARADGSPSLPAEPARRYSSSSSSSSSSSRSSSSRPSSSAA